MSEQVNVASRAGNRRLPNHQQQRTFEDKPLAVGRPREAKQPSLEGVVLDQVVETAVALLGDVEQTLMYGRGNVLDWAWSCDSLEVGANDAVYPANAGILKHILQPMSSSPAIGSQCLDGNIQPNLVTEFEAVSQCLLRAVDRAPARRRSYMFRCRPQMPARRSGILAGAGIEFRMAGRTP